MGAGWGVSTRCCSGCRPRSRPSTRTRHRLERTRCCRRARSDARRGSLGRTGVSRRLHACHRRSCTGSLWPQHGTAQSRPRTHACSPQAPSPRSEFLHHGRHRRVPSRRPGRRALDCPQHAARFSCAPASACAERDDGVIPSMPCTAVGTSAIFAVASPSLPNVAPRRRPLRSDAARRCSSPTTTRATGSSAATDAPARGARRRSRSSIGSCLDLTCQTLQGGGGGGGVWHPLACNFCSSNSPGRTRAKRRRPSISRR